MTGTRSNNNSWLSTCTRLIASITIITFTFNYIFIDFAHAQRMDVKAVDYSSVLNNFVGMQETFSIDTFKLPQHLGTMKTTHTVKKTASGKPSNSHTIIHIQDAHCNYAAQKDIASIIDYIAARYDIRQVYLEGGHGAYDLSLFTGVKDMDARKAIADSFMKDGELGGPEFYAITNPDKVTLWGIEDPDLYMNNLNAYQSVASHKKIIDKQLDSLKHMLNNLKLQLYTKELLNFDKTYQAYQNNNIDFKNYIEKLISIAWSKQIEIKTFPNMFLLRQTIDLEKEINFKQTNIERDEIVEILQRDLSKAELEELVLKVVQFKFERLTHNEFYTYLWHKARCVGADLNRYPNMKTYKLYTSIYEAIDKTELFDEISLLENTIEDKIASTGSQKKLMKFSKTFGLISKMLGIQLTKKEYQYYQKNKQDFDVARFITFINKTKSLTNIQAGLDSNLKDLNEHIHNIEQFYEYSFKRDKAFIKNIAAKKSGNTASIMITGGFHTENLCDLMKEQSIPHLSIMPVFSSDSHENPYFRLLNSENSEEYARIKRAVGISTIAIASMSTDLGIRARGRTPLILRHLLFHMREAKHARKKGLVITYTNSENIGTIRCFDTNWDEKDITAVAASDMPSYTSVNLDELLDSVTTDDSNRPVIESPSESDDTQTDNNIEPASIAGPESALTVAWWAEEIGFRLVPFVILSDMFGVAGVSLFLLLSVPFFLAHARNLKGYKQAHPDVRWYTVALGVFFAPLLVTLASSAVFLICGSLGTPLMVPFGVSMAIHLIANVLCVVNLKKFKMRGQDQMTLWPARLTPEKIEATPASDGTPILENLQNIWKKIAIAEKARRVQTKDSEGDALIQGRASRILVSLYQQEKTLIETLSTSTLSLDELQTLLESIQNRISALERDQALVEQAISNDILEIIARQRDNNRKEQQALKDKIKALTKKMKASTSLENVESIKSDISALEQQLEPLVEEWETLHTPEHKESLRKKYKEQSSNSGPLLSHAKDVEDRLQFCWETMGRLHDRIAQEEHAVRQAATSAPPSHLLTDKKALRHSRSVQTIIDGVTKREIAYIEATKIPVVRSSSDVPRALEHMQLLDKRYEAIVSYVETYRDLAPQGSPIAAILNDYLDHIENQHDQIMGIISVMCYMNWPGNNDGPLNTWQPEMPNDFRRIKRRANRQYREWKDEVSLARKGKGKVTTALARVVDLQEAMRSNFAKQKKLIEERKLDPQALRRQIQNLNNDKKLLLSKCSKTLEVHANQQLQGPLPSVGSNIWHNLRYSMFEIFLHTAIFTNPPEGIDIRASGMSAEETKQELLSRATALDDHGLKAFILNIDTENMETAGDVVDALYAAIAERRNNLENEFAAIISSIDPINNNMNVKTASNHLATLAWWKGYSGLENHIENTFETSCRDAQELIDKIYESITHEQEYLENRLPTLLVDERFQIARVARSRITQESSLIPAAVTSVVDVAIADKSLDSSATGHLALADESQSEGALALVDTQDSMPEVKVILGRRLGEDCRKMRLAYVSNPLNYPLIVRTLKWTFAIALIVPAIALIIMAGISTYDSTTSLDSDDGLMNGPDSDLPEDAFAGEDNTDPFADSLDDMRQDLFDQIDELELDNNGSRGGGEMPYYARLEVRREFANKDYITWTEYTDYDFDKCQTVTKESSYHDSKLQGSKNVKAWEYFDVKDKDTLVVGVPPGTWIICVLDENGSLIGKLPTDGEGNQVIQRNYKTGEWKIDCSNVSTDKIMVGIDTFGGMNMTPPYEADVQNMRSNLPQEILDDIQLCEENDFDMAEKRERIEHWLSMIAFSNDPRINIVNSDKSLFERAWGTLNEDGKREGGGVLDEQGFAWARYALEMAYRLPTGHVAFDITFYKYVSNTHEIWDVPEGSPAFSPNAPKADSKDGRENADKRKKHEDDMKNMKDNLLDKTNDLPEEKGKEKGKGGEADEPARKPDMSNALDDNEVTTGSPSGEKRDLPVFAELTKRMGNIDHQNYFAVARHYFFDIKTCGYKTVKDAPFKTYELPSAYHATGELTIDVEGQKTAVFGMIPGSRVVYLTDENGNKITEGLEYNPVWGQYRVDCSKVDKKLVIGIGPDYHNVTLSPFAATMTPEEIQYLRSRLPKEIQDDIASQLGRRAPASVIRDRITDWLTEISYSNDYRINEVQEDMDFIERVWGKINEKGEREGGGILDCDGFAWARYLLECAYGITPGHLESGISNKNGDNTYGGADDGEHGWYRDATGKLWDVPKGSPILKGELPDGRRGSGEASGDGYGFFSFDELNPFNARFWNQDYPTLLNLLAIILGIVLGVGIVLFIVFGISKLLHKIMFPILSKRLNQDRPHMFGNLRKTATQKTADYVWRNNKWYNLAPGEGIREYIDLILDPRTSQADREEALKQYERFYAELGEEGVPLTKEQAICQLVMLVPGLKPDNDHYQLGDGTPVTDKWNPGKFWNPDNGLWGIHKPAAVENRIAYLEQIESIVEKTDDEDYNTVKFQESCARLLHRRLVDEPYKSQVTVDPDEQFSDIWKQIVQTVPKMRTQLQPDGTHVASAEGLPGRSRGQGGEFYGLRQYQYGDDLSRMHHAASARSDKIWVKEFYQDEDAHAVIAIDMISLFTDRERWMRDFRCTMREIAFEKRGIKLKYIYFIMPNDDKLAREKQQQLVPINFSPKPSSLGNFFKQMEELVASRFQQAQQNMLSMADGSEPKRISKRELSFYTDEQNAVFGQQIPAPVMDYIHDKFDHITTPGKQQEMQRQTRHSAMTQIAGKKRVKGVFTVGVPDDEQEEFASQFGSHKAVIRWAERTSGQGQPIGIASRVMPRVTQTRQSWDSADTDETETTGATPKVTVTEHPDIDDAIEENPINDPANPIGHGEQAQSDTTLAEMSAKRGEIYSRTGETPASDQRTPEERARYDDDYAAIATSTWEIAEPALPGGQIMTGFDETDDAEALRLIRERACKLDNTKSENIKVQVINEVAKGLKATWIEHTLIRFLSRRGLSLPLMLTVSLLALRSRSLTWRHKVDLIKALFFLRNTDIKSFSQEGDSDSTIDAKAIQGKERYFLGEGNRDDNSIMMIDEFFKDKTDTDTPQSLNKPLHIAEALLHEALEAVTPEGNHKELYTGLQRRIFGPKNTLGKALRAHIDEVAEPEQAESTVEAQLPPGVTLTDTLDSETEEATEPVVQESATTTTVEPKQAPAQPAAVTVADKDPLESTTESLAGVLARVRFPERRAIILMPELSPDKKITLFPKVMSTKKLMNKEIRDEYGMFNVTVRFYNANDADNVTRVLQKTRNELADDNQACAVMFTPSAGYDNISTLMTNIVGDERMKCVGEKFDKEELTKTMISTHVVLGLGLIDLFRNEYEKDDQRTTLVNRLADLLSALGDETSSEAFRKNWRQIFEGLIMIELKPLSENLKAHIEAIEQVAKSL